MRISDVSKLNAILCRIKVTALDLDGKIEVINAIHATRPIRDSFDRYVAEAKNKLVPADYESTLNELRTAKDPLARSEATRKMLAVAQEADACIRQEAMRDVAVTGIVLSDKTVNGIVGNNELTGEELFILSSVRP